MGRTHSNAFLQAPRFFDLPFKPVLKAVCARNADRAQGVRGELGLRVDRDRLAEARRAQGHRPHRHRQPERHARGDRHCRRAGRQDGDVREAAGPQRGRSRRRWSPRSKRPACRTCVWYNYRRVPAVVAAQAADRRGQARPHLPLPREVPPGLDDLAGSAAGRRRAVAAGRRRSPAAASPAICWRTASTPRCG